MEQRQRRLQVDAARAAGIPVDRERNVRVEADQIAAQQGLIAKLHQVLLAFRSRHVAGMVENRFQRAVLFQQLPGELRPDQRHARHVVDRIAHQGLKIDDLLRRDSPFRPQRIRVENLVLADVEDLHPIGDQLPAVLVAGDQEALAAEFVGQAGDGGQDVVGLVRLAVQRGNAQGGNHAADGRNLRHQVLVHLRPLNLVLIVHRVAERLARQIEGTEQIVGLLLFQQVEQIAGEAEHGPHRLALRAGHLRQGVKDLMDQRVGIDHPHRSPRKALRRRRLASPSAWEIGRDEGRCEDRFHVDSPPPSRRSPALRLRRRTRAATFGGYACLSYINRSGSAS